MDRDQTGLINAEELKNALVDGGLNLPQDEIDRIMKDVDFQGNGKINYSEFLAATLSVKNVLNEELLFALFKHFDTDDSEYITVENIKEAFGKAGKTFTDDQIREMVEKHDIEKNGKISFEEF